MLLPLILSCGSILFANASTRAHDAIPVCRYRDLSKLQAKTQTYTGLSVILGLAPLWWPPLGILVSMASIGYMAYKRLA
jgi:hypothetical protein